MTKPVILTGLRANSQLHLGNYLGGILPLVELQSKYAGEYQVNMFVPDLHSFTTPIDHSKLYQQVIDNLRVFVAAGLDLSNEDTFIYRQSYVPAHSELAWILECFTGVGQAKRMTQFKEKSQGSEDDAVSVGLFNYPILMAADILLYGARYVPLGDDQKQHLELTRDLAIKLNNKFNQELFTVPEPWAKQMEFSGRDTGVRIRSLRNPEKKMSKSIEDPAGTIMLSDIPADAAKKIMRAETDAVGVINYNFETQPGISNLLQIHALLSGSSLQSVIEEWSGKTSYGELKAAVAANIESFLTNFQTRLQNVNQEVILEALAKDEAAMNIVANQTLLRAQRAVGLRP